MLEAKVKDSEEKAIIIACAGERYDKKGWRPVPVGREDEARQNPYLVVRDVDGVVSLPAQVDNNDDREEISVVEGEGELNATDAAIELAREAGIDISDVEGTGLDGRILKSDVAEAIVR